tara:strand:- start:2513 stop:4918 length:2406 start_codon:yes stop_codon:yes gene_type:complete
MIPNFTPRTQEIIATSKKLAEKFSHSRIRLDHLFLAILKSDSLILPFLISRYSIDWQALVDLVEDTIRTTPTINEPSEMKFSKEYKNCLDFALQLSNEKSHSFVSVEHILYSLIVAENSVVPEFFLVIDIDVEDLKKYLEKIIDFDNLDLDLSSMSSTNNNDLTAPTSLSNPKSIESYSTNLTEIASTGKYDYISCHDGYYSQISEALCRKTKSSVMLVGEAGVGKTALVEHLAKKISNFDSNDYLINKQVISLDLFSMVAGTKYRGQFEERLKSFIEYIKKDKNIILFIDEIHTLIGAGNAEGTLDAANILKPYLARGEITCIGATTNKEYKKSIEKDSALKRRFAIVRVSEPSPKECLNILNTLAESYSSFHSVKYDESSLEEAIFLSNRYIKDRALPDKAIDLIDQAGARLKIKGYKKPNSIKALEKIIVDPEVDDDTKKTVFTKYQKQMRVWGSKSLKSPPVVLPIHIKEIISERFSIPIEVLNESNSSRLSKINLLMSKEIIGQSNVISKIYDSLCRHQIGLKDENRPTASFLFLGKTGLGKTLTAKSLAKNYFGGSKNLIYFDMSEFSESVSTSKLIGSSPGYVGYEEGGGLTEKLKRNPYSVLLFDEIEKAHPTVMQSLLQILEEGRITDNSGEEVSCKHSVIILTSNVGAFVVDKSDSVGFNPSSSNQNSRVLDEAKKVFSPELINRLDDIVIFNDLNKEQIKSIITLEFNKVKLKLKNKNIKCILSKKAREEILKQTLSDNMGARPVRRIMQNKIETCIAKKLINLEKNPEKISLNFKDGEFYCNIVCDSLL